jgi:hypothetical protein
MNLGHLLSHVTAMIEAAHPKPVSPFPQRVCRALLGIDDGHTEVGRVFELGPDREDSFYWNAIRTAPLVIRITQLGNVPIVLRTITIQGNAILSGCALTVRCEANCGNSIELSVRALDTRL